MTLAIVTTTCTSPSYVVIDFNVRQTILLTFVYVKSQSIAKLFFVLALVDNSGPIVSNCEMHDIASEAVKFQLNDRSKKNSAFPNLYIIIHFTLDHREFGFPPHSWLC